MIDNRRASGGQIRRTFDHWHYPIATKAILSHTASRQGTYSIMHAETVVVIFEWSADNFINGLPPVSSLCSSQ